MQASGLQHTVHTFACSTESFYPCFPASSVLELPSAMAALLHTVTSAEYHARTCSCLLKHLCVH